MQTSPRRRPASRPPGTLAPMSISRSPAPPVVTEQRSALASAAMLSTSFAARAETLGAGPLYFCIVVSLPVWRLCIQHLRQFVQAPAAAVEGRLGGGAGGENGGDRAVAGDAGAGGGPVGGPLRPGDGVDGQADPGRHRGWRRRGRPAERVVAGCWPAQAARWALNSEPRCVVEHIERGAGARVDVEQVRACRPRGGSRTPRDRRRCERGANALDRTAQRRHRPSDPAARGRLRRHSDKGAGRCRRSIGG